MSPWRPMVVLSVLPISRPMLGGASDLSSGCSGSMTRCLYETTTFSERCLKRIRAPVKGCLRGQAKGCNLWPSCLLSGVRKHGIISRLVSSGRTRCQGNLRINSLRILVYGILSSCLNLQLQVLQAVLYIVDHLVTPQEHKLSASTSGYW